MHFGIYLPVVDQDDYSSRDHAGRLLRAGLPSLAQDFDVMRRNDLIPPPNCGYNTYGFVYTWRKPGQAPANPKALQWSPSELGPYSIGINPQSPPTPLELQRPFQWPGRPVLLGDGQHWLFPVPQRLPMSVIMTAHGLKMEPVRMLNGLAIDLEFVKEADRWRKLVMDGLQQHEFAELYDFCLRALQINYRLTADVANLLTLFTTENIVDAFLSIIGGYDLRQRLRDEAEATA